jgi:hypothetical protein
MMGIVRVVLAVAVATAAANAVGSQTADDRALTPLETAVACAPPPSVEFKTDGLHVTGSQDPVARLAYGDKDQLVLSGGTEAGVQLGQRYYIRRPTFFGMNRTVSARPQGMLTLGWVRVVAVNDRTAIASIEHFCSAIYNGDYLEPYAPPSVPADADRDVPGGEPDFSTLGHVLYGNESGTSGGRGDLMLIDRGSEQGVAPGTRFAVYRDTRSGVPLASVGEAVVVSIGKTMSLARITRSRDAVVTGDYVVPRK